MTTEEYKQSIIDDPQSEDAWAAYGEYLSYIGDIRGELIALELSGGSERVQEIYEKNQRQWLGEKLYQAMYPEPKAAEKEPEASGLFSKISKAFSKAAKTVIPPKAPKFPLKLEWQYGFIKEIHLKQDWEKNSISSLAALELAMTSPSIEFVQEFTINFYPGFDYSIAGILKEFKDHKLLAMSKVHLGNFEYPDENEISWVSVGNVNQIFELFPNLKDLHLTGSAIELGSVNHSKLKRLKLESGGLSANAINSVMKATLPELEDLEIWFGDEGYGAEGNNTMLSPLYNDKLFPKLKTLGLKNCEFPNDIINSLYSSDLIKQIHSLDMSLGTMTDDGAQVFINQQESFNHLDEIKLNENFISDEICQSLKEIYVDKINTTDQDIMEDDYLYVSVGE